MRYILFLLLKTGIFMAHIFILFFVSLSFATQIVASEGPTRVRTIDLQIMVEHKFSDEKDKSSPICIAEITNFTLDGEIEVCWGNNPYSLIGQELKRIGKEKFKGLAYVNNKKTNEMVDLQWFAQKNGALIDHLQQKTNSSLKSIPSIFLTDQKKHIIRKDRTLINKDMVEISRFYDDIDGQQFEVTLYMFQDHLNSALRWLKDSQSDKIVGSEQGSNVAGSQLTIDNNDFEDELEKEFKDSKESKRLPSFISYIKKPFLCLVGLLAFCVWYQKFYSTKII